VSKDKTLAVTKLSFKQFVSFLEKKYGGFETRDPFQVLIFTVLSQRTKDANTEKASRQLFEKLPDAEAIANAPLPKIMRLVKPSGFYKVKAKYVRDIARQVHEKGMPSDIDGLLALPGVGRKTANCVLNYGFGEPAIAVDVHVHRIANRWGFVHTKTPEQTEKALEKLVAKKKWATVNHVIVRFGQDLCGARPRCRDCPLVKKCPFPDKNL
jgi:endonuclease-3